MTHHIWVKWTLKRLHGDQTNTSVPCIVLVCSDGSAACFISAAYAYRPVELAMIENVMGYLEKCTQTSRCFPRRMRSATIAFIAGLKTKQLTG